MEQTANSSNNAKKFLQFNGKDIYMTLVEGKWWVAIKPICEALKVHYENQRELLKNDKILSQLPRQCGVVAADGKLRKMVCIPEQFVYGWLFSIQSNSKQFTEYKLKCYELLYNYFHGSLGQRNRFLRDKVTIDSEIEQLEKELTEENDKFFRLKELKSKRLFTKKALDKLDKEVITNQANLFQSQQ